MAEEESARYEAEVFTNTIARLTSVHRECGPKIDWAEMASSQAPAPSYVDRTQLNRLENALVHYRPTWWERLLRTAIRRRGIVKRLERARTEIAAAEELAARTHREAIEKWKETTDTAKEMVAGNLEMYEDAVADTKCLEELEELGAAPVLRFVSPEVADVTISVGESSVVPAEEKGVSSHGKLLCKKLPATRRQDIHQDYVCGAVLRVARELLAALPVEGVLAHAKMELLDSRSGHLTHQTVVTAFCPRQALANINWDDVDASDLLSRLLHRMAFRKGKGFSAVEPLSPEELSDSVRPAIRPNLPTRH